MRVRLTRKLAGVIDGVDVRAYEPGDVVDVPAKDAHLLIAEEWAIAERRSQGGATPALERRRAPAATANDRPPRGKRG